MPDLIDLRSDTVTKPTPEMRAVMAMADVGDDVYAEDPTINHLQDRVAAMLGKEAALFVPSGTMSNQIAVRVHTQPGDELLCDDTCHIFTWEAGGPAVLSGVTSRTVAGDYGVLDVEQLRDKIRPTNEHYSQTRLVTLENTHNRGGGRVYPLEKIQAISKWAHDNKLMMHLDGARLWNAHVASGVSLTAWAEPFDTVSVCFSKGLGAPVGSALAGPKDLIAKARRVRKLFGGAIRQGGVLAAAALYALDNHIDRLAEDHQNAKMIAQAITDIPGLRLDPPYVETNLVWFEVDPKVISAKHLVDAMKEHGILISILGANMMRACTHLDVSAKQAEFVADKLREVCRTLTPPKGKSSPDFD
ncbi:low-specificity L-threonine aldolase [Zavarzinella formosa]|uniref:low-specificity L-threonine aldolase n=1 Tax=Zavarzinella formosa TaxID=360055 RepID=UPI0002FB987D|nr:low-specificity L-threonine aldolase [Zavarzinella formosa]